MFTWRCLILWAVLVAAALSAARPAPTLPDQGKRHSPMRPRREPPLLVLCVTLGRHELVSLQQRQRLACATSTSPVPPGVSPGCLAAGASGDMAHVVPEWFVWAQKWVCGSSGAWGHFKPGEKLWQTPTCWFGGGYRALGAVSPAGFTPCHDSCAPVTIYNLGCV